MLHSVKGLRGYKLGALDGEIGRVEDFYFDDKDWVVRYVVLALDRWWRQAARAKGEAAAGAAKPTDTCSAGGGEENGSATRRREPSIFG